ncbi:MULTISPECIES: pentapeptide repeat-containing protein [unclassified Mesorhizobium]|uniref:pentapeptide repeat-containing protein n=1 Tax=Mesorhizobium TaxID=68287 RepID=UPI0003CFAEAE|nr:MULTISPECIES: pentapeptide repeat-containing protein [unclassified Mesorhizobium]ESZ20423.1 hypothetical protein X737_11460 [Mesorhizobium sp. L48C026A00]RWN52323.1 MAG: pentapeptide repeat-containing protein [Mesorhizobium sp.]RWN75785.1 MAG: pentapeptide repeat-containing protein [Mesorhizobium sp.]RWN77152.1 MAG: pentapeptide repeat-containing protein [Mesorhizobium sp.]RWN87042.1 MAG: pentapeptide repeat-containing protein [Mesorhizobium sp.]
MEVHDRRDVLDVRNAIVSNSSFDDVNMSNTRFHDVNLSAARIHRTNLSNTKVEDANLSNAYFTNVNMSNVKIDAQVAGMMINGISLEDLFQAYETAKTAGGN